MDENALDEILDALLSPLEAAEARSTAVLRALTETGVIAEDTLATFLSEAENASEIKARGLRLRLKRVLTGAIADLENTRKQEEEAKQKEKEPQKKPEGPEKDPKEESRRHPHDEQKEQPRSEEKQQPAEEKKSEEQVQPNAPQSSAAKDTKDAKDPNEPSKQDTPKEQAA